jgi:hypothetical protein
VLAKYVVFLLSSLMRMLLCCEIQIRLFESLDKLPSPDTHADKIINDVIVMERASLK